MDYQWYPGHMTKARRMMQENIRLIDLLIELTDARAPLSGRNPDIGTLANGKSRIVLLNKADLADESQNQAWSEYFRRERCLVQCINARTRDSLRSVRALIEEACREKTERDKKKGIVGRPVRAMVAGIPNVGKSTFINSFAGKGVAKTGNKPGVTKGKQWIRLPGNVELLDTPGILWPKFEDREIGIRLALIGSIRDEITDDADLAVWLIRWLEKEYPGSLQARYGIGETGSAPADGAAEGGESTGSAPAGSVPAGSEPTDSALRVLSEIARVRACLKSGGEYDCDRAATLLIDDLRSGRLGRVTLEKCPEA